MTANESNVRFRKLKVTRQQIDNGQIGLAIPGRLANGGTKLVIAYLGDRNRLGIRVYDDRDSPRHGALYQTWRGT